MKRVPIFLSVSLADIISRLYRSGSLLFVLVRRQMRSDRGDQDHVLRHSRRNRLPGREMRRRKEAGADARLRGEEGMRVPLVRFSVEQREFESRARSRNII